MMKIIKKFQWIEQHLIPDIIGGGFFVLAFGWMCLEAIARRFFGHSIEFSDEIVTFSLVWAIFLALAQAGREGRHVSIDLMVSRLSKPFRKGLNFFANVTGFLWGATIVLSTIKFIPHLLLSRAVSSSSLRVPMWVMYVALFVGGIMLALYYLEAAISLWKRKQGEVNP